MPAPPSRNDAAWEYIENRARTVTPEDVKTVLDREEEVREKVGQSGPFAALREELLLLLDLLRDYWKGAYREVPWRLIAALVAGLLYLLSPLDILPDVLPLLGLADDAMVLAVCVQLVRGELARYRIWRATPGAATAPPPGHGTTG